MRDTLNLEIHKFVYQKGEYNRSLSVQYTNTVRIEILRREKNEKLLGNIKSQQLNKPGPR